MIEKLYKRPTTYVVIIGLILTVYLFITLMNFADEGNLVMVLLTSVSIGIVAFFITRTLGHQKQIDIYKR
jgi:ribose/xylose/arabinose/galactoside ABC-type transport system permease subunit